MFIMSAVNGSHSTRADLLDDAVVPQRVTDNHILAGCLVFISRVVLKVKPKEPATVLT
jgi:hypothetical protein